MNTGQLVQLLRAAYLVPAEGLNKVEGKPFKVAELSAGDPSEPVTVTTITDAELAPKDYASDQEVRCAPAAGLRDPQGGPKTLAELGARRERTVFVRDRLRARFPYYLSTYGFHTIHGRAPTIATGSKLANPELDIWVVTGDGDGLSIGGNHMLHVLRRNVDLQILLFNNEITG